MKPTVTAASALTIHGARHHGRSKLPLLILAVGPLLAACSTAPVQTAATAPSSGKGQEEIRKRAIALAKNDPREKECLVRAMYFESNRSSEAGLLGVGTVVMNRVGAPRYPETICGVVGAPRQFAAGVLTRQMAARDLPKAEAAAEAILNGKRNESVGTAKHFHMAGLRFSYANMHYVTVAGGNAFYVKGERPERRRIDEPSYQVAALSKPDDAAEPAAAPAAFATVPLAFAPAAAASEPASLLVDNAPLPPNRPIDLYLPKISVRAMAAPQKSDARLAALSTGAGGLRGSLARD